jgi:hypothetical protein
LVTSTERFGFERPPGKSLSIHSYRKRRRERGQKTAGDFGIRIRALRDEQPPDLTVTGTQFQRHLTFVGPTERVELDRAARRAEHTGDTGCNFA